MKDNFSRALKLVLRHEGGYVDHPRDPGGATNLGITIGTLSAHLGRQATKDEVRALTVEAVGPIYRRRFWDVVHGDDLPSGVDYAVFDFAVNSGPARAARYLQAVVGARQDGVIGPVTLAAVRAMPAIRVIDGLCASRLSFVQGLGTWQTFGKGWNRRIAGVKTTAREMAATGSQPVREAPRAAPAPSPAPAAPSAPQTSGTAKAVLVALVTLVFAAVAGWLKYQQ